MAREMWDICAAACAEFDSQVRDYGLDISEPHDAIHEIADSMVPVYTADLMRLASEDISLATNEPECGPAFDGKPTPVNIVAANVYEAICEALWEHVRDLEKQAEDSEDSE